MEMREGIFFEGIETEEPARRSVINRMAGMLSKQVSQKGKIEKLEIIKNNGAVKIRLLMNSTLLESEGEDKNLFFAFGKARDDLLKKLLE